ncbi:hypothetical protein LIER_38994 [Lithospermum erythrorhizon]|uniref:Uncharacterized protein n=1 Tax=Lithospermum erythrorhizon TaxID=34254 RepID=A0AAV3QAG8_LITER
MGIPYILTTMRFNSAYRISSMSVQRYCHVYVFYVTETNNHTKPLGPYPHSVSFGFTQDESDAVKNDGTHVEHEQEEVKKNDKGRITIKSKICNVVAMVAQAKMDEVLYKKKEQRMSMTGFAGILKISKWTLIRTTVMNSGVAAWRGPFLLLAMA